MSRSSAYTVKHIRKGLTLFDYQWTRKVKAKTVSVALSKEQFEAMRDAIANLRDVKAKLARLEELSRLVIFRTSPDTRRFKRPTKATLGLGKCPKSP